MTPEEVEARFQRIEALLMQTAEQTFASQQQQEQRAKELDDALARIAAQQERTQEQLNDFRKDYEVSIEDLMQLSVTTLNMASENATFIRGLQVENRRILRELRDRR
jgi:hypothetical protein